MKSNEWYTPAKYIEAARAVMGSIDLDPASCELANQTVKATTYYTKEQNGLLLPWYGNVWLNPPYGRTSNPKCSLQGCFVEKFVHEPLQQAVMLLLGNAMFNRYFAPLWDYPVCFHEGKLTFQRLNGEHADFGFGTLFIYKGPHEQQFIDMFSQFGTVARRVSPPTNHPTQLLLDTLVSVHLPGTSVT